MRSALALLLLVAAPQDPGPDWSAESTDDMVQVVQRERGRADPAIFTELAGRGSVEAFKALQRCSSIIATEEALNGVFAAVAQLSRDTGEEGLGATARAWITDTAVGQSWAHQRPATRALASLGGQVESELRRVLSDNPDPRCKQLACGGLVPALEAQGDARALELLLGWYRAPTSGPPERLVRAIGRFQGEWVLDALEEAIEDKGRPSSVRVALVSSLALRPGEEASELLIAALRTRDAAVQLAGVLALEGRGEVGQRRPLEKLTRSRDEALRRAAFVALDELRAGEEEWEKQLAQAADGKDVALRLAAAELYARRPGQGGLDTLVALITDESHLVRAGAVRSLAERRSKLALPLLIDVLAEDTLRMRLIAREALVELTGLDHGPTAARWRAWWQAEGAAFVLPAAPDAAAANALRERRLLENPTQAEFYGIQLSSDRVCFVLDISGSMDRSVYTGGTRLEAAVDELVRVLDAFPVGGGFNLVFFSDRVRPWKPSLVEMDAKRLTQATKFARAQRAKGGTALYDGLIKALEDEEVDTIVLLSDGEPTVGELTDPENILADVQHRNRLRGVVVHCIALNFRSELLEGLAAATGGGYREVH